MSIQSAINSALGVSAAAVKVGTLGGQSGPSPAEVERLNEQYQVRNAEAAKKAEASQLIERQKAAMAAVKEKQQAIKMQLEEREKNRAMVKEQFSWVGTLGPDAQKAAIRQLPELQAALLKDKKLEESINGK